MLQQCWCGLEHHEGGFCHFEMKTPLMKTKVYGTLDLALYDHAELI